MDSTGLRDGSSSGARDSTTDSLNNQDATDSTSSSSDSGGDSTSDTAPADGSDSSADTGGSSSDGADSAADTGDSTTGDDASDSSSSMDSSADGGDGSTPCTTGAACSIGNVNGVCVSGTCTQCNGGATSTGIDTGCTNAYGGSSSPWVCISGSCAAGNCTANTACAAPTPTCGLSAPNFCGGCTSDGQCSTGQICVTTAGTTQGTCVSASAGGCTTGQSNAACPLNAADECCAGSCYPGNCCIIAGLGSGCTGAGVSCRPDTPNETLGGGICTACPAVTGSNPVYFVDPMRGSDSQGTGNSSTFPQCAFQTITRALQVIGTTPQPNTTISVVGGTTDAGVVTVTGVLTGTPPAGQELFPLTIRQNITVTNSTGPVTISVPPRTGANPSIGFLLTGNPSAIVGGSGGSLVIDGRSQAATVGVTVQTTGASLSTVTVQGFATADVAVADVGQTASAVAINAGVQCLGSAGDGLLITGASSATVVGSLSQPTLFNNNAAHGIRVNNVGVLTLTGNAGASPPSSGTVIATGNGTAGIWVQTTSPTQSTITGVVSTGSTTGNGIRIIPGSNVKVRSSWLLGNSQANGVLIENSGGGTIATVNNIDLGTGSAAGGNVLQATSGNNPNGASGICMRLPAAGAAVTLSAAGNLFQGGVNCASAASVLVTRANRACAGGADVGGTIVAPDAGTGNKIDVTMCSYP